MRTKKLWLVVLGLVMLPKVKETAVPAVTLAVVRVMWGVLPVALLIVKPVAPLCAVNVAEVVVRPATVPQVTVVTQYSNLMEPTLVLPTLGSVKANV